MILGFLALFPMKTKTLESMAGTLIIAVMFLFLQTLTRNDSMIINAINIIRGAYFMCLAVYFCSEQYCNRSLAKKIFWVAIIAICITQITTIIGVAEFPLAARLAINGDPEAVGKLYAGLDVAKLNIGGYALAYMAPVITSLLFFLVKNKRCHWIIWTVHVVLTFWFLFAVQFTLAILLYIATVFALLFSGGHLKWMLVVAVIVVILCLLFQPLVSDLFSWLADAVESDVLSGRFNEIAAIFSGSAAGEDTKIRFSTYTSSIQSFFESPWFGKILHPDTVSLGGHSAILDYAAASGLFGLFFMILNFCSIYRKTLKKFKDLPFMGCVYFSQIAFFVYAFLNPAFSGTQFWILFLMPVYVCIMMKGENNKNDESTLAMQHADPGHSSENANYPYEAGKLDYGNL